MDSFRKVIKMGANLKTCKRSSSSSTCSSLVRLLKLGCLRSEKIERKRVLTPENLNKKEKSINDATMASNNKSSNVDTNFSDGSSFTTLGQWLLSSSGSKPDSMKGGELYVLRSHYSSRRVHPSSSSSSKQPDHAEAAVGSKARDSFSMQCRNVKNDGDEEAAEVSLDIMSTSKLNRTKSKKKVSFRLPEEADIIVFYPSDDMFIDCEQNFV